MHMNVSATEIIFPWNWAYRQTVENLLAWVLGIKLRSSVRTSSVLNHCSVSPAPSLSFCLSPENLFLLYK